MLDIHIHTGYCPHAVGKPYEYVQAAHDKGITLVGFSDHLPLPARFHDPAPEGDESAMSWDSLLPYLEEIGELRKLDPGIMLGVEVDLIAGYEKQISRSLSNIRSRLDYVLGSCHFLGEGWGFDIDDGTFRRGVGEYFGGDARSAITAYYSALKSIIRLGYADVIAHMDLIKKFNKGNKYFIETDQAYQDIIDETLKLIRQKNLLVELNTSGIDKPVHEIYPSLMVLGKCNQKGIKLTLGSDAHAPNQVGRYFDKALALAKAAGYSELHYLQAGKLRKEPIL